jgi:hypothetical protein
MLTLFLSSVSRFHSGTNQTADRSGGGHIRLLCSGTRYTLGTNAPAAGHALPETSHSGPRHIFECVFPVLLYLIQFRFQLYVESSKA